MTEHHVPIDVAMLCRRHHLELVERLPSDSGSFVARVRDISGREMLLKQTIRLRGRDEIRVMKAWRDTPYVPQGLHQLQSDTYAYDWVDGQTLVELNEPDLALTAVGAMIRTLHDVTPPPGLRTLRLRLSPKAVRQEWEHALSQEMLDAAESAASELYRYDPKPPALLHGDLVPGNVFVTKDGPVVIDPVGYVGLQAWDLAQLAVALKGRDRRDNLSSLLAGYGRVPPLMPQMFAWMTFMFLEKNLTLERRYPGTRADFVAELTSLATLLVHTDPHGD